MKNDLMYHRIHIHHHNSNPDFLKCVFIFSPIFNKGLKDKLKYTLPTFWKLVRDVIFNTSLQHMDITDSQDGHVSRFAHLIISSPQGQETHLFFLNHFPPPHYLRSNILFYEPI